MTFSRLLVATAVLAGLAAPAAAEAARTQSPVKAATTAAQRYWGATPCNGRVTVVPRSRMVAGMAADSDAWVTFSSPQGSNNLAAPASSYRNCRISLARWRWPNATSMSQDWDLLCATIIHETGHLLGRPHDTRQGSIMAPVFDDASRLPSICRKMRPRAAR